MLILSAGQHLNGIRAKHWLGLTATPERRDGLEDLIYHQLGPHHATLDAPPRDSYPPPETTRPRPTQCFIYTPLDSATPETLIRLRRAESPRSTVHLWLIRAGWTRSLPTCSRLTEVAATFWS